MSRRRTIDSGLCQAGFHGKCPHLMQQQRTVVKNTAGGSRVTEIPELLCGCKCHKETK